MKFLLDTDALSEPARKRPSAAFLSNLSRHVGETAVSTISIAEIVFGAERISGGHRYLSYLHDAVLPHIPVVPVDVDVAVRYGALRATLERQGSRLADLDLLIAATALSRGLELVTRNRRHFVRVEGLDLPDWFRP